MLLAKQNSHKYCPFIIAKSLFLLLSAPSDSPSFPIGRNAHCRHSVRKCQEVGGSISSLHPSLHSFSQDITFIIRVLAINSSSFLVFYLLFLHIARFTRELMQCCTKALFPMAEKIRQHHALGYPKPNAGGFIISLDKLRQAYGIQTPSASTLYPSGVLVLAYIPPRGTWPFVDMVTAFVTGSTTSFGTAGVGFK